MRTAGTVVVLGALVAAVFAPQQLASATTTVDPSQLGRTAATAAGSCWDVKQHQPSATDGVYWLLTPAMTAPQQFYCDQTTDGGGWVLIGKGRDGWTADYDGKGTAASLLTPTLTTMSAATSQLRSRTVDALNNNQRVDSLTDGVRLRRAMDAAGTSWQESRMVFKSRDRWVWTFGAAHPLASYSFNGVAKSGGVSSGYGLDNAYQRVNNVIQSAQKFHAGFAYGSGVTGTSASTSYLWSATDGLGGALPYTQVYIRPKVSSDDPGFTAIPDSGTAPVAQRAVASSFADELPWHVTGLAGDTKTEGNVEVQAFTQSGSTMYVGGNFARVQRTATSTGTDQVNQPFLAAFDVRTGELVTSFRPVLNEQVRTLATLPNGDVVAGGSFSSANGQPATGIVALDPVTGATDPRFALTVENRVTGGVLDIKSLAVRGSDLYVGGSFTHLSGGSAPGSVVYSRNAAIVSAVDGTPRSDWNPELDGTVNSIDPSDDGQRAYVAGFFTTENGAAANHAAAIQTTSGAPLATPAWNPVWSSTNSYQRAIDQVGDRVFVGGSEHSLFSFSTSTFSRLSGNIMMAKGDIQHIADAGGVLYASCHCNQFNYSNAYTWPSLSAGWTQADAIGWFGAYDAATQTTIPQFTPDMTSRLGSGVWAITVDSNGRVWAGGDLVTAATKAKASAWSGGFARFSPVDSTAPTPPGHLTKTAASATTVSLSWTAASDDAGAPTYQVLRDDRVIGTTSGLSLTVPRGGSNRFFVRAADASGNVSASTPVLDASTLTPPTAAFTTSTTDSTVAVDASGTTPGDDSTLSYAWTFGDGTTGTGRTTTHTYGAAGSYHVTLTVTDGNGQTSSASADVTVTAPRVQTTVVSKGSTWAWRYAAGAPPTGWNAPGADTSGWSHAAAPLGFGSAGIATNVDTFATTSDRPLAAYFTRSFQVTDTAKVVRLTLQTVADDGVVVYVNGTEVARSNMPSGPVTYQTYASSARSTFVANSSPVTVDVPVSLLVNGANTVSAETHLNYRATKDASFDLSATLTTQG